MTDRTDDRDGTDGVPGCTDDRFRYDDAAYLLGALPTAERTAYEAHFRHCPACSASISMLRPAATALRSLPADALGEFTDHGGPGAPATGPVPDTLLPGLLHAARRQRRIRLGAVAAGVAAALAAVLIWTGLSGRQPDGHPLQALLPTPVHATARLESVSWGTQVVLDCRYDAGPGGARPYDMLILDRAGGTQDIGSWTIGPGSSLTFTGGTALPADQIAAVEVAVPGGPAILRLSTS